MGFMWTNTMHTYLSFVEGSSSLEWRLLLAVLSPFSFAFV